MPGEQPFWRHKRLSEMSQPEWESLCDGCGKCCLVKLEDVDTGVIDHTNVACRLLDLGACRCTNYAARDRLVPDCIVLSAERVKTLRWLPATCAYRLVDEGKDLAWWHPLVSGDPDTVHQAGISIRDWAISEREAGDIEDHIVGEEP